MRNINGTLVFLILKIKLELKFKRAEVLKDLNAKKAKQENDIPIKLVKKNINSVLSRRLNFHIDKTSFPNSLKQTNITPFIKKMTRMIKTIIHQSAFYPPNLRLSKRVCMIKSMFTLILFFLRPNAVLIIEKWRSIGFANAKHYLRI